MRLYWRWVVSDISGEKDISDKKLILFGCGNFFRKYASDMQFNDFLVIDGDTKKHGTSILIDNKPYVINAPEILKDFDVTEYYIVITVQNSKMVSEIEQMIKSEYPLWSDNICLYSQLDRSYPDIVSMLLCDPFVHRKIDAGHISVKLPEYIKKANDILAHYITKQESELRFSAVRLSSRVILIIKHNDNKYLLHFPYNKGDFCSESNLLQNFEIRKRLKINDEFILYEAPDGFALSRFMETENDFSDKNVISTIMRKIRNFHESGEIIDVKLTIHEGINVLEKKLGINENSLGDYVGILHRLIIPETKAYKEKIIHGDLSYGNILHFGNHIEIIDWTFMQMGDPMFDVCLFYYFVSKYWVHDFAEVLGMYFEREPREMEYKHAKAWLILISYWKYLEEIEKCGARQDELLCELKKRMDGYVV